MGFLIYVRLKFLSGLGYVRGAHDSHSITVVVALAHGRVGVRFELLSVHPLDLNLMELINSSENL